MPLREQKKVGLWPAVVDGNGLHGPGGVDAEPVRQGTFLILFTLHSQCPDKPRKVSPQPAPNEQTM